MSRTIHVRLDTITLAHCYNIIYTEDQDLSSIPMATAVKKTLEAFINGAVLSGSIESLTLPEAEGILAHTIKAPEPNITAIPNVVPMIDDNENSAGLPDLPTAIQRGIDTVLGGGVVAGAPAELPPVETGASVNRPFKEIADLAPLDALVKQTKSLVGAERVAMENAIEVVYSHISEDMWGTAKAVELVQNTLFVLGGEEKK